MSISTSVQVQQLDQCQPRQTNAGTPKRFPRKSILKSQRPTINLPTRALSRSITDRFPLELFRIVIDWLHINNAKSSIVACSLVCRAWVPLCRVYYTPRMTVSPTNAELFVEIMGSPHLTIGGCVEHLVIQKQEHVVDHFFLVNSSSNLSSPTSSSPNSPFASSPSRTSSFSLSRILKKATSLASVTKITLQKGYNETSKIATHLKAFRCLDDLELRSFEFKGFSDLTAVISAQPSLRRLSLTDIAWGPSAPSATAAHPHPSWLSHSNSSSRSASPDVDESATHRPPPNLKHLALYMEHQSHLFNWMLSPGNPPMTIENVELGGIMEVEDGIAVSRFLRGLGPILKHLWLYSPTRISQVNLVHNTGLQSIKISHLHITPTTSSSPLSSSSGEWSPTDLASIKSGKDHNSATDEVCTILSQLCSSSLSKISLQLLVNDPESFKTINWHEVARMLSLPRYRNLQMIQFRIPRWRRWMAALIAKNIPDIAERGIFSVAKG